MTDHKSELTETLKRLLRVPRHELDEEERKWQEEQAPENRNRKAE